MNIYSNTFENYPSGTTVDLLNISGASTMNVPSQYRASIRPGILIPQNVINVSGCFWSGTANFVFNNSNTPPSFVYSGRFSFSGSSNYSSANAGNLGLCWNVKGMNGTALSSLQNANRLNMNRNSTLNFDSINVNGSVTTLQTFPTASTGANENNFTMMVSGTPSTSGAGTTYTCFVNDIPRIVITDTTTVMGGGFGFITRPASNVASVLRGISVTNLNMSNLSTDGLELTN